jgi:hypothetical protein
MRLQSAIFRARRRRSFLDTYLIAEEHRANRSALPTAGGRGNSVSVNAARDARRALKGENTKGPYLIACKGRAQQSTPLVLQQTKAAGSGVRSSAGVVIPGSGPQLIAFSAKH